MDSMDCCSRWKLHAKCSGCCMKCLQYSILFRCSSCYIFPHSLSVLLFYLMRRRRTSEKRKKHHHQYHYCNHHTHRISELHTGTRRILEIKNYPPFYEKNISSPHHSPQYHQQYSICSRRIEAELYLYL